MKRRAYMLASLATAGAVALLALLVWQVMRLAPPGPLGEAHAPLASDCLACHDREDHHVDTAKCAACHTDPATGEEFAFDGFARHHLRKDLQCLACHSEHHGADAPATRDGVTFATVGCETCHRPDKLKGQVALAEMPMSLRGKVTHFPHEKHPAKNVSCNRCHPMNPRRAHELVGPYAENCSSCHHGPGQRATCDACHKPTADYYAGRFDGRRMRRGSHGRSDEVTCVGCHKFAGKTNTFKPPSSTCDDCHPPAYTRDFLKDQEAWRQWRKAIDTLPKDYPYAKQLQFIGRYWYHNDTHAEKVRKTYPVPATPDQNADSSAPRAPER